MNQGAAFLTPSICERVELARYAVSAGSRVLFGQRIDSVVRVSDRPAGEGGRSFLIESGLEEDGHAALRVPVDDYVAEAGRLNQVPMATSVAKRWRLH